MIITGVGQDFLMISTKGNFMKNFSTKNIVVNKLKLHTEAFGNPSHPACLLIAGKMSTGRFWSDVFCEYLAKAGFFTIRYDHRDIG
jgi:hypothetical protein